MKLFQPLVLAALAGYSQVALAYTPRFIGCYKAAQGMKKLGENEFQSMGICAKTCVDENIAGGGKGFSVLGMTEETLCYCSNLVPNDVLKVDDDKCSQKCPGSGAETCKSPC